MKVVARVASLLAVSTFAISGATQAQELSPAQEIGVAQAQFYCLPQGQLVEKLTTEFQETVAGLGLGMDQKSVVELYVSDQGSWTILMTLNNGMSCITAAGRDWTETEPKVALTK